MKRDELLKYCHDEGIKKISNLKKKKLETIVKDIEDEKRGLKEIMMEKSNDSKDPISLETFDEWTLFELKTSIFCNGFYYKEKNLKNYICYYLKKTSEKLKDPVNSFMTIPENVIDNITLDSNFMKEKEILQTKFDFKVSYFNTTFDNGNFYCLYLDIHKKDNRLEIIIQQNDMYTMIPNERFLIGYIPINLKAIDTMSTSEAIVCRISDIYTKLSTIEFQIKSNTLTIKGMKSIICLEPMKLWSLYQKKTLCQIY